MNVTGDSRVGNVGNVDGSNSERGDRRGDGVDGISARTQDDDAIRIAMWSGPRNLSTAMMRSWENRPDTVVMDEPLYAAYLSATGLDHPGSDKIIAAGPADYDEAIRECLAPIPTEATVSYQKHMSHHLLAETDRSWIGRLRNVLLLRDPRRVLASYTRVRAAVSLDDIGLPQQIDLIENCELVVDSDDFLHNPAGYQRAICRRLGVDADDETVARMLAWPAGRRASDGVWAPHWYSSVEASTGFGPPSTDASPELLPHLHGIASEAVGIYQELRARRLRPGDV